MLLLNIFGKQHLDIKYNNDKINIVLVFQNSKLIKSLLYKLTKQRKMGKRVHNRRVHQRVECKSLVIVTKIVVIRKLCL